MKQIPIREIPPSDQLFAQIFGEQNQIKPEVKTLASFSQIMTLAHNFNRKHGHMYVSGCNCQRCKVMLSKIA